MENRFVFYNKRKKKRPRKLKLYVCDWRSGWLLSWKQSYRRSQMHPRAGERIQRETSPFSSFHCFARLPSRAWHEIGANGRAWEFRSFAAVLIFSQQQMFFPQSHARVCTRLRGACTSLSHSYFTAYRNLHCRARHRHNACVDLSKILLLIQIKIARMFSTRYGRCRCECSSTVPNSGAHLSLLCNWKLKTISFTYESALIVPESTVLYKFGLTPHLLLESPDVIKVTRPRRCFFGYL